MSRTVLATAALLLAAPVSSAAPVPPEGGKGVVFPFPAKAPLVVCLHGYDKARDRLGKMLAAALPKDAVRITKALDDELAKLTEGRKLDAVRKDARAFVVVNDLTTLVDDVPAVSVLVPVTAYKEFVDTALTRDERGTLARGNDGVDAFKTVLPGEETPAYLVDLKDYVALTLDRHTAGGYAAKYPAGNTDAMGSELGSTFLTADVALYVNMDQINDQLGDQIRAAKGFLDFGLLQAQQQGMLGGLSKSQVEAAKELFKALFQAVEDCRGVVVAAEFKPEGLLVRAQVRVVENSPSAKLLGQKAPGPGPLVAVTKLPAGFTTYQGARFGKTIAGLIRELGQPFATTEEDERGAALIERHLKDLAAAGPGREYAASAAGGAGITVTEYEDTAKAVTALTKAYKAVAAGGRVNGVVVKVAPRVQDEAQTHRKYTFSEVTLKYDFDATVTNLPDGTREPTLEALKRTRSEKTTLWIGGDEGEVIQLVAKDWDAAKATLDAYLDADPAVGGEAGFKLTRSHLPAEANLLLIGETGATLVALADSLKAMEGAVPDFPRIPPLKPTKGPPTYLGLAVTLKGETATVTAFVPGTAMNAARRVLDPLFRNKD